MTDFRRDMLQFAEMMARGEISNLEVDNYGSYFEIVFDENYRQRRQYDRETEARIED